MRSSYLSILLFCVYFSDSLLLLLCVSEYVLSFNCLLQTAVAVGVEPGNKLPYNEYYEYFGPDYTLHVEPIPMENKNLPRDLEKIR